jgi:hypothetical protein
MGFVPFSAPDKQKPALGGFDSLVYPYAVSITQRYWLIWSPGLILAGFFSVQLMIAFFLPSYFCYYAHRKEWTLAQFAWRAFVVAFGLLWFFMSTAQI